MSSLFCYFLECESSINNLYIHSLFLTLCEFWTIVMNKDEELLIALELRIRQLMLYCDSLKEENDTLKIEIKQKEEKIIHLNKTINELELNYNDLKFAKAFSSENIEERHEAKRKLLKLVRDVDKCISILKG